MDFDLSQFQPTDDDKREARRAGLLSLAAALFGTRKGLEGDAIGRGIAGYMGGQQGYLDDVSKRGMQQMHTRNAAMELAMKQQAFDQQQQLAQALAGYQQPSQDPRASMPSLAPTPANAATLQANTASAPGEYERLTGLADYLRAKGLGAAAEKYYEMAAKAAPQYGDMQTVMGPDGQPTLVQTYKNRAPTPVQGYGPRPDIALQDLGGKVAVIDKLRAQNGQMFDKTMTPGEVSELPFKQDNAARGWAGLDVQNKQLGISGAQLALARAADARAAANQGTLEETPEGVTRIIGTQAVPVLGADGKPVTKLREQPAAVKTKVAENAVQLANIDAAVDMIDSKAPGLGTVNRIIPDWANQIIDAKGVPLRAIIAGIGGQKFHDLSGAAISVTEAARLQPYIPSANDDPKAARVKLVNLRREMAQMQDELAAGKPIAQVVQKKREGGASGGWSIREVR